MRVGALCPVHQPQVMHLLAESGFGFLELVAADPIGQVPNSDDLPQLPIIWQAPYDLPADSFNPHVRAGVLAAWRDHLKAAASFGATLMVVQFRHPMLIPNQTAFIEQWRSLLQTITEEANQANVQVVLRNSPDNRNQLKMLREIVRETPRLGVALDVAYAHLNVVKNLTPEYLWDTDLWERLAHLYVSDTNGRDAHLRLPLGSLQAGGPDWSKLVAQIRERYNASVTIDVGSAVFDYLVYSRQKWLEWWEKG